MSDDDDEDDGKEVGDEDEEVAAAARFDICSYSGEELEGVEEDDDDGDAVIPIGVVFAVVVEAVAGVNGISITSC